MKTQLPITCLLLLLPPMIAANTDALNACRTLSDDSQRLACYDRIGQANDPETHAPDQQQTAENGNQFPVLLADLNEPNLYVSYGSLDFLGDDFNAFLFGAGIRQSVRDFQWSDERSITFNVYGQIRSQFDVDELDTRNNRGGALINTDFTIGGELVQSLDDWNWRFSYSHRSTHLGDEFIIDNPNYLTDRLNLSYEVVRWTAHKPLGNWDIYGGLGFITRSEPGNLAKDMWQLGWQWQGAAWHNVKPIWAVDLHSWGAYDSAINLNTRLGLEIQHWTKTPFQVLLEYQDGHSPYGQFYTEDLTFAGLTFLSNWR